MRCPSAILMAGCVLLGVVSWSAARAETGFEFALIPGDSLVSGDARGRVSSPSGIAVDDFGRIYVSDATRHRLVRFDADGTLLGQSGSLGSGPGRMRRPGSVATLGTLAVAVLDRENRRVLSFDLHGRALGVLVDFESAALREALGRVDPVAMASDRGGAAYVADAERDRVLVFDFAGRLLRVIGGFGAEAGSFRGLRGIGAGVRGEMVTAERDPPRAQRLDASGAVVASWTLPATAGREALAVALDGDGRVAVADEAAGTLWLHDRDGRVLAVARDLARPTAVAFARDGTLWVAEAGGGRVRRWRLEPRVERVRAPGE